ncbi:MAG: hypothetical protein GX275_02260 [Clostridiales bacterium]|nr:hypothetical protein [Clostridiales bacterium]
MARIYDIISRLENGNQKPKIRIDNEHEFIINNSKAAALKIMTESKEENIESMDNVVKIALGKEAYDYIESLELSMPAYTTIINSIMAAIGDVSLEEIEAEAEKKRKTPSKR